MLLEKLTEKQDVSSLLPKTEDVLRYVAFDDGPSEEELILSKRLESDLENILKEHENKKAEISASMDQEEADLVFNDFLEDVVERERQVGIVYYDPSPSGFAYGEEEDEEDKGGLYVVEDEESEFDYLFVPRGMQVLRVSQNVLGPNVLGRTWIGSGQIEILDTLYGDAFKEVLQHEVNHLLYPHENESEIRARTRRQVPNPIYH